MAEVAHPNRWSQPAMTRVTALFAVATVMLGLALGWYMVQRSASDDTFAACRRGSIADGTAAIGGPFTLVNGAGERVSETDVITKPTLLYFGYTFCPDFCPTDLARNAAAADILREQGADVGLVFVTVDPERDTPEVASEYATYIHPSMIGLSGSAEDTASAANAYRVFWRKSGDEPETYLMDHSTFTYLAAPGHPFLEFYPSDASAEAIAENVACYARSL